MDILYASTPFAVSCVVRGSQKIAEGYVGIQKQHQPEIRKQEKQGQVAWHLFFFGWHRTQMQQMQHTLHVRNMCICSFFVVPCCDTFVGSPFNPVHLRPFTVAFLFRGA